IGFAPAVYASWCRKAVRDVAAASAIGVAILAAAYGGAALASQSVGGYVGATRAHSEYVRKIDSYHNPGRPPVLSLFSTFFAHSIPGGGRTSATLATLALISALASAIERRSGVWMLLAMFLPFIVFALFMLDVTNLTRFSTNWAPLYAVLAV